MPAAETIAATLRHLTGWTLRVTLDGTAARPLRAARGPSGALDLSLHPSFALADERTLRLLARHLRHPGPDTAQQLRQFVRAAGPPTPTSPQRRTVLRPRGRHHDLTEICRAVNREHFGGTLQTRITWGRAGTPLARRRRSIVFGSYDAATDTVRIHPALDSPEVPRLFLEYIVFHELLHAVHPVRVGPGGRRVVHSRAFVRAERRFPRLREARALLRRWQQMVR